MSQQLEQAIARIDTDMARNATVIAEVASTVRDNSGSSSSGGAGGMADVPYERRRHFTIGNLGCDSLEADIVARAIEFLTKLDIKPEQYEGH